MGIIVGTRPAPVKPTTPGPGRRGPGSPATVR